MLYLMRKYASTWLIKIILGAIVVVFVFWGVGSYRAQRASRVALVNGEPISIEAYRDTYNRILEQLRKSFGNRLDDEILQTFQVRKRTLDQLINQTLLLQEALKFDFRISDEELFHSIRSMPAFQSAGIFDSRLYKRVLNSNRLTPETFEDSQKKSMLIEKLRSVVLNGVKVSDPEAIAWFKWKNRSVKIHFVVFAPDRYQDIQPSPDEINVFYGEHKNAYKTEPKIKARYLHFNPDDYRENLRITEEQINDYYESNPTEFKTPKTVEARHILLKVDENANRDVVEEKRKKILDILKMARKGEDFAELAKKYSEGPTKENGGYLGTFQKEAMVKPFAEKAFSMNAGEISEPVRTRFGWHLIRVEKVNEASTLSLKDAKDDIRKKLIAEKAKALAYDDAEVVYDASFEGDDLVKAAEDQNRELITTDFFSKKGPDKGIPNPEKFATEAFKLSVMDISDILDIDGVYYILQVIGKKSEEIPPLAAVKERVKADLIKEEQDKKARRDAAVLLADLKNGKSMSEASQKFNLAPRDTDFFKRFASIPNIGYEPNIAGAAFKLSAEKKIEEKAIKGSKGYYVIEYAGKKDPDLKEFDKEKENIIASLLRQKQLKTFETWLSQLKSRADISVEENFSN